jgi:hypothetical protein
MSVGLMPNNEYLAIDSEDAVPADGTVSETMAIPQRARLLSLSIRPVGTFSTLNVQLQVANNDVAAEFATLKNSTSATGEYYTSGALAARFCRVVVVTSTGASRTGLVVGVNAK